MTRLGPDSAVLRADEAAFRVIDGQAVIVVPRDARILTLNPVGTEVWKVLDGRTLAEVAAHVVEQFDGVPEGVLSHVEAFVGELVSRGLASVRGGGE